MRGAAKVRRDTVPSSGVPRLSCAAQNVLLQFSFFFSSGKEDDHLGSCDDASKAPSTEAVLSQSGSLQPAWLQEPNPAWPRVPEPLLRPSPERQDRRSLNLPGRECASACVLSRFSRVRLLATPWTVASQAPLHRHANTIHLLQCPSWRNQLHTAVICNPQANSPGVCVVLGVIHRGVKVLSCPGCTQPRSRGLQSAFLF